MTTRRRQLLIRGAILITLVVLILYFSRHAPQPFHLLTLLAEDEEELSLRQEKLMSFLISFGPYSAGVFVLLQALQVVISPIPGELTGVVGGYVYGKEFGFIFSTLGLTLGSWIAFELARILGRPFVERWVRREILEKFNFLTTNAGTLISFLLFLLPGFPKDYLCYVLGLTRMNLTTFLVVSAIGGLPGTYLLTVQGASLRSEHYLTALVFAVISAAILLVAYCYRHPLHRWIKGKSSGDEQKLGEP